jgi:DNA repair protein RadA/Sms
MIMTGHVTKEGVIAGPKLLEHAVDVVLYLEGDQGTGLRLLRGVKNRFGPTDEVGVFEMRGDGMAEVADPSRAFLDSRNGGAPGSALATIIEGTRPFTVEVQALTSPTVLPSPRRLANGLDPARLALVAAVLGRRLGVALGNQDIIVNVPGGLRVREPAIDLAVALAIISSLRDLPVVDGITAAAEVGLGGELRPVGQVARRVSEAVRLGLTRCLVATGNQGAQAATSSPPMATAGRTTATNSNGAVVAVRSLAEAIEIALPRG